MTGVASALLDGHGRNRISWQRALRAATTLMLTAALLWFGWHAFRWAVLDATWVAPDRQGCRPDGACWAFVGDHLPQFLFGMVPPAARWRAALVLILPVVVVLLMLAQPPGRSARLPVWLLLATPPISLVLLSGGLLGLAPVPSDQWGGLSLTVLVGSVSFAASLPLAIVLALARRSRLPVIRALATGFIELWRGLPLVGILFMAVILLPLFLPPGASLSRVAMAITALTAYSASYLAEVLRGGLQAIPPGQFRAARALGFGSWRAHVHIILPQALGMVVPGIVNTAIALFKDTTYVMIVGLFDFTNIVATALSDPKWMGSPLEGYLFIGLVYWLLCFGMSRFGRRIEQRTEAARGVQLGRA